jgi:hypothetical protein
MTLAAHIWMDNKAAAGKSAKFLAATTPATADYDNDEYLEPIAPHGCE